MTYVLNYPRVLTGIRKKTPTATVIHIAGKMADSPVIFITFERTRSEVLSPVMDRRRIKIAVGLMSKLEVLIRSDILMTARMRSNAVRGV
jgi:hypothetical protein